MSDESVQAIPGIGKLTYTFKQYLTYATALQEKAKQLTTLGKLQDVSLSNKCRFIRTPLNLGHILYSRTLLVMVLCVVQGMVYGVLMM